MNLWTIVSRIDDNDLYQITFKKANGNGQTSCGFMANNNTRNDMQCGVSTFTWDLKGIWGFYVQQM